MKKRFLNLFLLLPFIILLVSGCKKKYTAVEVNQTIKGIIANEENCLKGCDATETQALSDFENCMRPIRDEFKSGMERCSHLSPGNQAACETAVLKNFERELDRCLANLRVKIEEANKCRNDCRNKFPLEFIEK